MLKPYVSTLEGSKLTGKDPSTLKRFALRQLKRDPQASRNIFREKIPSGYRYKFNPDYLFVHFKKNENDVADLSTKVVNENFTISLINQLRLENENLRKELEARNNFINKQADIIQALVISNNNGKS